ncbi:MAG: hypothetical protein IRZ26_04620 [Clostridia bacterium]|nr:hypothetical protein [Clostridia bacterium]MCL6522437.1 hypothetical protein [Bacillota bacterium]
MESILGAWHVGQGGLSVGAALLVAFLLGVVHGVTPDEHTWPITFSYAIGGYSARRGLVAGLVFSLSFTLQRALASELAYFALLRFLERDPLWDLRLTVVVGLVMALAGLYVLRLDRSLHLHLHLPRLRRTVGAETGPGAAEEGSRAPTPAMAAVHGFIAGWGFGAYALVLYSVLAPTMPGAALAWAPGAAFGLGTTLVQATAGALFGWFSRHLGLPEGAAERLAHRVAGNTLTWGGLAFVLAGLLALADPPLADLRVATGLRLPGLEALDMELLLVVLVVLVIGLGSLAAGWRREAGAARARREGSAV